MRERYIALSSGEMVLPRATSQQSLVTNLKLRVVTVLPSFANQSVAVSNRFDTWLSNNVPFNPNGAEFPQWTATGLVAYLGAPTNYFTSTPQAGLMTNALGWVTMTNVLRSMVWTIPSTYFEYFPTNPPLLGREWYGWHTSSWAAAKVSAETNGVDLPQWVIGRYTQGRRDESRVEAHAGTFWGYVGYNTSTQFVKAVDFYQAASPPFGFWATYSTFDDNGDAVSMSWTWKATTSGVQGAVSNLYGNGSWSIGNWVDDPPSDGNEYARGYDLHHAAVIRWTGFNFQ